LIKEGIMQRRSSIDDRHGVFMPRFISGAREVSTALAFAMLFSAPASALQINVHVPPPKIHIPVPTKRIPIGTQKIAGGTSTSSLGASVYGVTIKGAGSTGNNAGGDRGSGHGPKAPPVNPGQGASANDGSGVSTTPNQLSAVSSPGNIASGLGVPIWNAASTTAPLAFYTFHPFFPFNNIAILLGDQTTGAPTGVGGLANSITNGSDDDPYSAVVGADQAAIAAAQQALTTASACAVDPSLSGCSSAETVQQATENLSNAQNAFADFYSDVSYLLWLYSLMESGLPLPPGFSPAAAAAVEAAVTSCLATPSTCDATIAKLETVLAELGVPSQMTIAGQTFTVLESPSEIAGSGEFTVQAGTRQATFPELLNGYEMSWLVALALVGLQ
jgi:hypothetical protein